MSEIGHNSQSMRPFDALAVHIDGLYMEAKNWLDGAAIENEAQAEAVASLIEQLRQGANALETARKDEAKPWDDGKREVQERFKPVAEKAEKAVSAAKVSLTNYLTAKENERLARLKKEREEAAALEAAAAELAREAQRSDQIEAREVAEEFVTEAKAATAEVNRTAKAKSKVSGGGARALSMRTSYEPELEDFITALDYFSVQYPAEFDEFLLSLARKDIQQGKRQIPGVKVHERKSVA